MSVTRGILSLRTSSWIRATTRSGPTWYGRSVMTSPCRALVRSTISAFARILKLPRPDRYASAMLSSTTMPPEGKSGPGRTAISSSTVGFGRRLVSTSLMASRTSARLWPGMLVAIPTAMPEVPLTNRFGSRAGRYIGSSRSPSKVERISTVSSSISASMSTAAGVSRHSV